MTQSQAFSIDQHRVFLSLGSNIEPRELHLKTALQRLRAYLTIDGVSSLYETAPVGYLDQPDFLNMVCQGQTSLAPEALLTHLKSLEKALGREETFRNGPRVIDIDILFYDDLCYQSERLAIPHPRMNERAFVLVPLAEIAPSFVDPRSGSSIQTLLASIPHTGVHKVPDCL